MQNTYTTITVFILLVVVLFVVERLPAIIINWTLVAKAGQPGWTQLVPIYASITRAKIADSFGFALGFIVGETGGVILLLTGLILSVAKPAFQAPWIFVVGMILVVLGNICNFVLNFRFSRKFVIATADGQTSRQLYWRSSLFLLFSLKYIQYANGNPVLANAPNMLGYAKSDYVPTGFDKTAIAAAWVGAFSFPLIIPAPVGLVLGIVAMAHIRKQPTLKGRARAIFAIVWGGIWTLGPIFAIGYIIYKQ